MNLDFLENINAYGDSIMRFSDFNRSEVEKLRSAIKHFVADPRQLLHVDQLSFIKRSGCHLTFRVSEENIGITTIDKINFLCDLTDRSYQNMIFLLEPFCDVNPGRFQWLYDLENPIELLITTDGTW